MAKTSLWTGGIGCALWLASGVAQATPNSSETEQCAFERYAPTAVAPYSAEENVGYGSYSRLSGAQMFVPAHDGLTAEWLTLSVERSLAHASQRKACGPPVRDVSVTVSSGGSGFWVRLSGTNHESADALLRWAQRIVPTAK